MRQVASHFQVVLFRSLRDAPECSALLEDCLQRLAPQFVDVGATDLERRLSRLVEELRQQRVLLVLDNLESVLQAGEAKGRLRPGYEGYARLLQAVAQRAHQSGLLLTSREKPAVLRALEGRQMPVRSLRLTGLEAAACEQLLASHELLGSPQERARLVERYEGNPLALNIVAQTIADLFGGQIAPFLAQDTLVFGSISELLDEHWGRLSTLEQTLLFWLAILREPVTLQELQAGLVAPLAPMQPGRARATPSQLYPASGGAGICDRAARPHGQPGDRAGSATAFARAWALAGPDQGLCAPDPGALAGGSPAGPPAEHVAVEQRLRSLLEEVRNWAQDRQGYGPANLATLLRLLRADLRGLDLSRLALRGVYLQGVELQDANLAFALLRECLLTQSFDAITALATSLSGQSWAVASRRGQVRVWHERGNLLHLSWQAHSAMVHALAFSPDERLLASGSIDGSLKLWDVESGGLLWSDWQTRTTIEYLAFSPGGLTLAEIATLRMLGGRAARRLVASCHLNLMA